MAKCDELLALARRTPRRVWFDDAQRLAACYGFTHARTAGSHDIYVRSDGRIKLNIQSRRNGYARDYQVRQLLAEIDRLVGEGRPR